MTTQNVKIKHEKQPRVWKKTNRISMNLPEVWRLRSMNKRTRHKRVFVYSVKCLRQCTRWTIICIWKKLPLRPRRMQSLCTGKKFMCTTTWERTACLNINKVCLVTKHLSSGCSPAGAQRKSQGWGRSCSRTSTNVAEDPGFRQTEPGKFTHSRTVAQIWD